MGLSKVVLQAKQFLRVWEIIVWLKLNHAFFLRSCAAGLAEIVYCDTFPACNFFL
jgi:hypothetical protein